MGSFRCYDSSNVIATLMMTNFHLNTTDVAIFPNVCLWRRSLCSDLVLTLKNCIEPPSYARTAYVVAIWPSFLSDSFIKIWATCEIFLGKWFTAPPGKKFPVRLWWPHPIIHLTFSSKFRLIQVLMYAHFMKRQRAKFIGKNKTYWLKKSISHNGKWETIRLLSAITKTLQRIEDLAFSLIYHVKKPNFTDCNIRKEHRFYKLN